PNWMSATCGASAAGLSGGASLEKLAYDPSTHRTGARCDVFDNQVNLYGKDPATGFARRPVDNVGIQYGLGAVNAGKVSAEQFVELNEKVGGYDGDGNLVQARSVADTEALRIAYQDGRVNSGGAGMAITPIIDLRTYTDKTFNIHDRFRTFAMRERLI